VVLFARGRSETDMSTQVMAGRAQHGSRALPLRASFRIGLLGCGNVGSALVRLLHRHPDSGLFVDHALVRHARGSERDADRRLTTSSSTVFADDPDVIVELLGGCEPARELVVQALEAGIPVVTANKSLLARHGRELRETASRHGVPLLYEAAVIAGVPFLGTFARRPFAAQATGLVGIVNGTSNFVLSHSARTSVDSIEGIRQAQALGYAEPDPANDINGTDAAEKLAVLLQHFAGRDVSVDTIEREGIQSAGSAHHSLAAELGGAIKPVVQADWTDGVEAFVGPAFVPAAHPLHHVHGVENALLLETARGRLLFQGPGAGPDVTAATVMDDVYEVVSSAAPSAPDRLSTAGTRPPETGWFVSLDAPRLPANLEVAEYLAAHGIYVRRGTDRHTADGRERQALLTWPVSGTVVRGALAGIEVAAGVRSVAFRTLEASR
jgi:homoserine dehydrogenase